MICSQPGCSIETSGYCLEGFEPDACPYLSQVDHGQEEILTYDSQELIDLPSGEALTEDQTTQVLNSDATSAVLVAGPTGSGKTTILTSLYEAFLEAPFANYLFAGSQTLVGFERRCHEGRRESGRVAPDTTHTSMREGVRFLHLKLARHGRESLSRKHLLLSDISGELFKRLRDSSDAVKSIQSIRRANYLCIVIDGKKISAAEDRQLTQNDSRSILRSIIDSGMLPTFTAVDVVFTKWDVVMDVMRDQNTAQELTAFIDGTKSILTRTAAPLKIRFHEVAARPEQSSRVPFAHGLPTLLRSWMGELDAENRPIATFFPGSPRREFWRCTEAKIMSRGLEGQYDIRPI